jgi:hypothetical protein
MICSLLAFITQGMGQHWGGSAHDSEQKEVSRTKRIFDIK